MSEGVLQAGPGAARPSAVRVGAAVLGTALVAALSGALFSSASEHPAPATRVLVWLGSGLLYAVALVPPALRAGGRRRERFLLVFVPLYLTGAAADLVEGYFYSTELSGPLLAAALLVEVVPTALAALAIVLAVPGPATAPGPVAVLRGWLRERSARSWCWRILAAGVPYAAVYELFAFLVTPIEHRYYYDRAFIASLHTRVPPEWVTLVLEAGRGVLFVLAAMPVLALARSSRRAAFWQVMLLGAVLEAYVPLLGRTSWPVGMRLGNVLELTGDAAGRAALMVLFLLAVPAARPGTVPERAADCGTGGRFSRGRRPGAAPRA